jgi:hypothetical protein
MTKISQLTNIGSALAADDEFVVRDVSDVSTPNKKVTSSGIIDYIIAQGGVSGFSQIAAGVGPLARALASSSGTTGTLVFGTASAGSLLERARIDSAGRFLVGVTTARADFNTIAPQFQVENTSVAGARLGLTRNAESAGAAEIFLAKTRSSVNGGSTVVLSGDSLGGIAFWGADGTGLIQGASIIGAVDGTPGTNDMPGRLVFFTTADGAASPTERMRITSAGNVGIGITSPSNQLQLSTDSAGKPSTNTWTIVSDERIKEDVELADLDLCYQAIKDIPLKRFKWKDEVYTDEQVRDRHKLGWIAQDVEAVFPKAVGTHEFKYNQIFEEITIPAIEEELDEEGNVLVLAQPERIEQGNLISEDVIEDCRDLNSDQLYAAMYGAMQKLIDKVEALEGEITILKGS